MIATFILLFILLNNQKPNNNDNNEFVETLTINASDITCYIDECIDLNFTISTNAENYQTNILFDNSIMLIENKIYPQVVGETTLTIVATTNQNTYTKTVTIIVLDIVDNVEFYCYDISGNLVDKIFAKNYYKLKIIANKNIIDIYQINTTENINNFTFNNKNNNVLEFSFYVKECSSTQFNFIYRKYSKTFNIPCYSYIDNFNINFKNSYFNNQINLYLFNENYTILANNNNFFNNCEFSINLSNLCLNSYQIISTNSQVAKIENNKIIAVNEGECELKIIATDGSGYCETYIIKVNKILIESLYPQSKEVDLLVGESYELIYNYLPIYALADISISYSSDLIVNDNTITANKAGKYTLVITDKLSNKKSTIVFNVTALKTYRYEIQFNENFLQSYGAIFNNNILQFTTSETVTIPFSYNIVGDSEYTQDITTLVSIKSNPNLDTNVSVVSNAIMITLNGKGEFYVTLSLKYNTDITYTFKIIIN